MQIHELNNFTGTLGSGAYLAIDDGNDTGKISSQGLLAATEARIDNIIAGPAPSAEEIVDARLGDDGVTYPSLGDAIRDQFTNVKSALTDETNARILLAGRMTTAEGDIDTLETHKVAQPLDEYNQPTYGTDGQSLRTKGDGKTEWADVGLPTDEQTAEAVSNWLDNHPEATTTVLDGSLTDAKFSSTLKLHTLKDYVTPQMFGAKADNVADDADAFQAAIDSGKPVVIPRGEYKLSHSLLVSESGTIISGCGSEEDATRLNFHGTNGIVVASDIRWVTIENICLVSDTYTYAGIEISYQESSDDGSVHYLTVQNVFLVNFKYGLCVAGYASTGTADNKTYLWDCSFKDIKTNTMDAGGDNCAIKIFPGASTHFGILFERVTCVGYTRDVNIEATTAIFTACNFGINSVNSITCEYVSDVVFEQCNFECDSKVTGTLYAALIYTTFKTTFIGCNFYSMTDSNVSFIGGGLSSTFVFISNKLKFKTGDEMTDFFSISIPSAKGSIVFGGGNTNIPRPNPYKNRSLQTLDLERSVLPLRNDAITIDSTDRIGEMQFDVVGKTGGRPIWYDGNKWMGAPKGEWTFIDAVTAGNTTTLSVVAYSDRPRTVLITVRGHHQDVYAVGIISKYRDNSLAAYASLVSNKCSIAVSNDTVTITNSSSYTEYMYASVIDLI